MKNHTNTIRRLGATSALGLGLVIGGVGIAAAATSGSTHRSETAPSGKNHGPHGPRMGHEGGTGTVTAMSPASLTIQKIDGTSVTFALDGSTVFKKGHSAAAASDVTVGSKVSVVPTTKGSTTAAAVIIDVPHLVGKVTAVDGSTITLADSDGFWRTVSVDGSTTYSKAGASASASDVTVGQVIGVEGSVDANHTTLDASSVSIGLPARGTLGGPGGPGGPGFPERHGDGMHHDGN
ncbi:MAG: DUF5666 domain-containing protein [Actinomycetes bacterium]